MAPFASFHGTAMSMAKSAQANPGLRTTMIKDRTITAATLALQCILHSLCNRWRVNVPESISTGGVTGQALPDSTELPFLDSCTDWSEEEALDGAVALSRLLRNLCVEGEVAQCALQEHRSLDVLLEAARAAISAAGNRSGLHDKGELFLVAVLQALGNAVVNCNGNRRALWEKAWPDPLLKCALQNTACKGIVGMIVYQCLQAIPDETVRDFARSEEAGALLYDLLLLTYSDRVEAASDKEKRAVKDVSEWTELVLAWLVQHGQLRHVHQRLAIMPRSGEARDAETLLWYFFEDALESSDGGAVQTLSRGDAAYLADEFGLLLGLCLDASGAPSATSGGAAVVGKLVQLLQVIAAATASADAELTRAGFRERGLLKNVIHLLKILGSSAGRSAVAEPASDRAPLKAQLGLKRDLVRVIGNLCYRDRAAQDQVRELGGIPPILESTKLDDQNPFAREWGVWAVRNLCEGNMENQREIEGLKPQALANETPQELKDKGIEIELDKATGKVRVKRDAQAGAGMSIEPIEEEGPEQAPRTCAHGGPEVADENERMAEALRNMGLEANVDKDTGLMDILAKGAERPKFSYPFHP